MRAWLKKQRLDNGLTQLEVSKQLNISEGYYSMIENGERQEDLNLSLAKRLSEIFNISVEKIIEEEEKIKESR